ncbi:MAG: hypothetical protein S4CHLAM20_15160 [Chlamydiia bacterium]|nr:hypothetical protein [Chlamydiia bacterium]
MKRFISHLSRYFTVGLHFTVLMASIIKTSIKRFYLKLRKRQVKHPHLQSFIDKRVKNNCNLMSLFHSLREQANPKLQISELVDLQQIYTSKDELLKSIPVKKSETEIIAIPIAITAFSFFRHFVTLIIDLREGVIEFYDPIGFSIAQYKNAILWGPKCAKGAHLTLKELVQATQKFYQINEIIENRAIHQKDFNQCALFVYDRIYKRGVEGLSFQKAGKAPLTSKQAFI